VNQGILGDCWFLSAASSIAEFPGRMEKVFFNTENNMNTMGIYAVNFWTLGVPHSVIVDDYLPLVKNPYTGSYRTLFTKPGDDGSLWTAILEKAFAKYYGNYEHIAGGQAQMAVSTMTGSPYLKFFTKDTSADELWEKILAADRAKHMMNAGSPAGSDKTTDASGLV